MISRPARNGAVKKSPSSNPHFALPLGVNDTNTVSTTTTTRRQRRKRYSYNSTTTTRQQYYSWQALLLWLIPIIGLMVVVCCFLLLFRKMETTKPAVVLSPQQVMELHQAHEHAMMQAHRHHHLSNVQQEQQEQEEAIQQEHVQHEGVMNHKDKVPEQQEQEQQLQVLHHRTNTTSRETTTITNNITSSSQHHVIPNVLIFTHSIHLLNTKSKLLSKEDLILKRNVRNTIRLQGNNSTKIRFLTDEDCLTSIANVMGNTSSLLTYFQNETVGMFKADICRGAALYETGGLYFDVDLGSRLGVWDSIRPTTEFVVPRVHLASKHKNAFFQAFIGSVPNHVILKKYLHLFVEYYKGDREDHGTVPLGVVLLRKAFDDIVQDHVEEWKPKIQLFQEVLYTSQWFQSVPPPTWGKRRACKFVVVANHKPPFVVPFYSRIKGSRMCGGIDSNLKNKTQQAILQERR